MSINPYPMAMITAPGLVEFQQRSAPALGAGDVLIKVRAASICGSDLHIYKGRHPAAAPPVAIGHEFSGEVHDIGDGVTRVRVGDRVTVEPVVVCSQCDACRRGRYHLCERISFQYRQGQGAFASYFVAHENWVHRLPDGLSFEQGALIEPLAVALHAVEKARPRAGSSSAVFGDGAIGLLVLSALRLSGVGRTFVVGGRAMRLQLAMELGAAQVFNHREDDAEAKILEATGQTGVDSAFEAAGSEKALLQSLRVLKKGGAAVIVGLYEEPDVTLPANLFVQREIALMGSQGYCWDFQTALDLVGGRKLDLSPLISHVLPLEALDEAFKLALDPGAGALKVVMRVD